MSRPIDWGRDGRPAEPVIKASVILRPRLHKRASDAAKEAGLSLSQFIADLLAERLKAA